MSYYVSYTKAGCASNTAVGLYGSRDEAVNAAMAFIEECQQSNQINYKTVSVTYYTDDLDEITVWEFCKY